MSGGRTTQISKIQEYLEPQTIPEVFFQDGDVVIQAGHKIFKVYRGILASQSRSVVFKELLSGPPRHNKKRIGDPAIIHLPDNPDDVEHLLKAVFHANYFSPVPYRTTVSILIGVLRLSVKYDIPTLRMRAFQHLSTAFPTLPSSLSMHESNKWTFDISDSAERVALTQVADEVGATWALPIGLHKISYLLSFEELYYGLNNNHRDDDALLTSNCTTPTPTPSSPTSHHTAPGAINLQEHHRRVCLKMHSLHSKHCFTVTSFLLGQDSFNNPVPGCTSPNQCARNRYQWLTTIQRMALMNEPRISPLYIWPAEFWDPYSANACQSCLNRDMRMHKRKLDDLWQELPILLELPDWDLLKRMKGSDLKAR